MIHLDVPEQRSLYPVIVALRNRIELMVVAAGALQRETQDAASDRADHVVQVVEAILRVVILAEADLCVLAEKARRNQTVRRHVSDLVARDLLAKEYVVRLVVIKCADHIIAIPPRIGTIEVVLEAVGIRITGDVEPVAPPPFAIMRRGQQAVDQSRPRTGLL